MDLPSVGDSMTSGSIVSQIFGDLKDKISFASCTDQVSEPCNILPAITHITLAIAQIGIIKATAMVS